MYKSESLKENETNKIICDFDIPTNYQIQIWPDLVLITKKKITYHLLDFTVPANDRLKIKESEKLDKYLMKEWFYTFLTPRTGCR